MAPARVPDGFDSRWKTIHGLRLHELESAGGLGLRPSCCPAW